VNDIRTIGKDREAQSSVPPGGTLAQRRGADLTRCRSIRRCRGDAGYRQRPWPCWRSPSRLRVPGPLVWPWDPPGPARRARRPGHRAARRGRSPRARTGRPPRSRLTASDNPTLKAGLPSTDASRADPLTPNRARRPSAQGTSTGRWSHADRLARSPLLPSMASTAARCAWECQLVAGPACGLGRQAPRQQQPGHCGGQGSATERLADVVEQIFVCIRCWPGSGNWYPMPAQSSG